MNYDLEQYIAGFRQSTLAARAASRVLECRLFRLSHVAQAMTENPRELCRGPPHTDGLLVGRPDRYAINLDSFRRQLSVRARRNASAIDSA